MPGLVLYSDFNCPFCYATHERLERLGLHGRVEWRGVEHAPELPVPMRCFEGAPAAELEREVEAIRLRAGEVPIAVPPGKPNTGPAIRLAAAAMERSPERGEALVLALYRRFWRHGEDISDPAVLERIGGEAGLPPLADEAEPARSWQREWWRLGLGGVPLLVRPDGRHLYGLVEAAALQAFLADPASAGR